MMLEALDIIDADLHQTRPVAHGGQVLDRRHAGL